MNFKKLSFGFVILFVMVPVFSLKIVKAESVEKKLSGKILLQVEQNGEAWYVNPGDGKRYYMGRPSDAFILMRQLGVGITNRDLEKISVGIIQGIDIIDQDGDGLSNMIEDALGTDKNAADSDKDGYDDQQEVLNNYNPIGMGRLDIDVEFAKNNSGRIFLQVDKNGEAWYINPGDSKRYFLGRPEDAFNVMRRFGLGITDDDLGDIVMESNVIPIELYGCTYEHNNTFNTNACFSGVNALSFEPTINIHGGYIDGESVPWKALFVNFNDCPNCDKVHYIEFKTETHSNTECSLSASIDINNISKYNQHIFPSETSDANYSLKTQDKVMINISPYRERNISSFMIEPNPSGCNLMINSFRLLDNNYNPLNFKQVNPVSNESEEIILPDDKAEDNSVNYIDDKEANSTSSSDLLTDSVTRKEIENVIKNNIFQYYADTSGTDTFDYTPYTQNFYLGCQTEVFARNSWVHTIVGQAVENTYFSIIACPANLATSSMEKFYEQITEARTLSFDAETELIELNGKMVYHTNYEGPAPNGFLKGDLKYDEYILKAEPYYIRLLYTDQGTVANISYDNFMDTVRDIIAEL